MLVGQEPFDELSKALATGVNRRRAIQAVGMGVLGGWLALFSGEARPAPACRPIGKPCQTDADCCGAGTSAFCYSEPHSPGTPNSRRCTSCLPVGTPTGQGCLEGFAFCCSRVVVCEPEPHCAAPA